MSDSHQEEAISARVEAVLKLLTLGEKIGQINQRAANFSTGAASEKSHPLETEIRSGGVGSLLNISNHADQIRFQKIALEETRMKIPLLYGFDVIYAYSTAFPIPLGQAASFDLGAIGLSARILAREASANGIHWTFAPMIDVSRDARWGRVAEGAGEDTWWTSRYAEAQVRGFQGDDLLRIDTVAACAKHLAGYGAVEGGADYETTDISERVMREVYLPPFQAAVNAGAATVMNSFCTYARIPASCSNFLVRQVLKEEWGFKGFVVSDWGSFRDVIKHGVASNDEEAAEKCMNAMSDMDMEGSIYSTSLASLVGRGRIQESQIDDAVRRVLRIKFMLGLFDDPFRYFNEQRRKEITRAPEHLEAARDVARKSLVLLKNENRLLPLRGAPGKIAVIGQLADSREHNDYIGNWCAFAAGEKRETVLDGLKMRLGTNAGISYAPGGNYGGVCPPDMIAEAVRATREADVVVLAVGENGDMGCENRSRVEIGLPGNQEELVRAVLSTGKPVICLLFNNRPLAVEWLAGAVPALLLVWQPGTMGGAAIADVLFGDHNPSARLPMSFPRKTGQVPVYYNKLPTGKNPPDTDPVWTARYLDASRAPLFPFGYGLSYTTFDYTPPSLSHRKLAADGTLSIKTTITNSGTCAGTETAQLYLQDMVGSVSRPIKELRGIRKIFLEAGESKEVEFSLTTGDLKFWTADMRFAAEPGTFKVFVGGNSEHLICEEFELL